jgi:hypothetical protein
MDYIRYIVYSLFILCILYIVYKDLVEPVKPNKKHNFKIGEVVISRRTWCEFTIAEIDEKNNMLIDEWGKVIRFDECQKT